MAWSTRTLGARHGVGKDTVARIWRARGLRTWKVDTFKLSSDPRFETKLVDVVGLYLNPPAAAAVFCFDERTQVQALDRTQPSLPMVAGRAGKMTHNYRRNGTTDLFAALNAATGEVLHDTRASHTGRDVLAFFRWIDAHVDPSLSCTSSWTTCPPTRVSPFAPGWNTKTPPLAPALDTHLIVMAEPDRDLVLGAHAKR
jgi:hypothetical protein